MADETSRDIGRDGVRQGQVREQIKSSESFSKNFGNVFATPSLAASPTSTPKLEQTEAEKFELTIKFMLHAYGLPKPALDEIYRTCLRTGSVEYVLISTSLSTDLGDWLRNAQPYSDVGILLILVGFFGSLAQAPTRSILMSTLGRLIGWVRKG